MFLTNLSTKISLISCAAALLIVTGCGTLQPKAAEETPLIEINVSAAMGLKPVLLEIQQKYETAHRVKLIYNLASSGALQSQIEQGAPADIFISAANKQMDELQQKDLIIPTTRQNLVGDQLVLITPKDSQLDLQDFKDLTNAKVIRFGMGSPDTVPAGEYARQVLEKLHLWATLQDKAVMSKDIHTVLTYVETGNVEAGIVFSTVAAASEKIKVAAAAPPNTHDPIIFLGAVVRSTKHPDEAATFLQYLTSPEAMAIFNKYGFKSLQ